MDILEEKGNFDLEDDIKHIMKILKFKNNPIELKGSSNLKSQQYFSDYDLFTQIIYNYAPMEIYSEFKGILRDILDSNDIYFIELKIQQKNNKFRWFPNDDFELKDFLKKIKNVDFVKIDIVARINNEFIEISSIYNFKSKEPTEKEELGQLNKDIIELKKEKKYYKVLKRMFSEYKLSDDSTQMIELSKIFNGELGELYKKISNMEAIELIRKYYDDAKTNKKIEINLNDIGESENNYKTHLKEYNAKLNKNAKHIYNNLI
jgi:hypothetical protein